MIKGLVSGVGKLLTKGTQEGIRVSSSGAAAIEIATSKDAGIT
jgi:hypothetical protein